MESPYTADQPWAGQEHVTSGGNSCRESLILIIAQLLVARGSRQCDGAALSTQTGMPRRGMKKKESEIGNRIRVGSVEGARTRCGGEGTTGGARS